MLYGFFYMGVVTAIFLLMYVLAGGWDDSGP